MAKTLKTAKAKPALPFSVLCSVGKIDHSGARRLEAAVGSERRGHRDTTGGSQGGQRELLRIQDRLLPQVLSRPLRLLVLLYRVSPAPAGTAPCVR